MKRQKTPTMQTAKAKRDAAGNRPQLTIVSRRRICDQFLDGADERQIARREGVTEHRVRKVIRTSFDVQYRTLSLVRVIVRDPAAVALLRAEQAELEQQCWQEYEEAA